MAQEDSRIDPIASRDAYYAQVSEFKDRTRQEVKERREKIDGLKGKRQELRLAAANTAGLIGLRYLADSNSYIRLVSGTDDELVLPDIVQRPDPLTPDEGPALPIAEEKAPEEPFIPKDHHRGLGFWLAEMLLWLLVVPVGAFVGVGLATLAGFVWQRNPETILPIACTFGVAIVAGLKLLLTHLWALVGRQISLRQAHWTPMVVAVALTLAGCGLDAHLGAMALRQYSLARTFREADAMSYGQSFFLALAITTPLLLAAAVRAYRHGLAEPGEEDHRRARSERERERWQRRQDRLEAEARQREARREEDRLRHRNELAAKGISEYEDQVGHSEHRFGARRKLEEQREADWAELRSHPEFKCLQGLIGQIGVLDVEIAEHERELTSFKIGRGYEKSEEFPNGKPALPLPEKQAELDGQTDNAYIS